MGMSVEEWNKLVRDTNAKAESTSRKIAHPEHDLQVACLEWFAIMFPEYRELMWATPNAAKRNKITASILKREGMRAGVPDLFLAVPAKGKHGLFIEMKNGKAGRLSPAQSDMLKRLDLQGYQGNVCRTLDEFKEAVKGYLCKA